MSRLLLLRSHSSEHHPLIVVGGAVASINPLPLAPAVDIFVLGSAELLWPPLLRRYREIPDREQLLETLAGMDGYFVPGLHLDGQGRPSGKRRRVEKRDAQMNDPAMQARFNDGPVAFVTVFEGEGEPGSWHPEEADLVFAATWRARVGTPGGPRPG